MDRKPDTKPARDAKQALLRARLARSRPAETGPPGPARADSLAMVPASPDQNRYAFRCASAIGSPAYSAFRSWRITGPLDIDALKNAIDCVVRRQGLLRARFEEHAGRLRLLCDLTSVPALVAVDVCSALQGDRLDLADKTVMAEVMRAFDLAAGPLFRASLFKIEQNHHVLVLNLHHSICDGWSFGVLHRELAACYQERSAPEQELSALPVLYARYASEKHRIWSQGPVPASGAYWLDALSGELPVLTIPWARPRPARQSYRGQRVFVRIAPGLRAELERMAVAFGATVYTVLMAVYAAMLTHWSGQSEVVIGSPMVNRAKAEHRSMIGLFANPVPLRIRMADDWDLETMVRAVQGRVLQAFAHADVPLQWLAERLGVPVDPPWNPLFQAHMVFQNTPDQDLELPGLRVDPYGVDSAVRCSRGNGTAKFDLNLCLRPAGGAFEGFLEYNVDLFDQAMAETMRGDLLSIVNCLPRIRCLAHRQWPFPQTDRQSD